MGVIRAAAVTLPVGIALFIGGFIAIAAKATALGGVLIALAVVSVATGCVLLVVGRNRTRAYTREMQASQQADLGAAFRDYRGGGGPQL